MTEYTREGNLNTPEYWDSAWTRTPEGPEVTYHVHDRVAELLSSFPHGRVVEYGFGHLRLARLLGKGRWEGRESSSVAVDHARAEGFSAYLTRCADSPGYRKAFLVALEVLEHLDQEEMEQFLGKSRNAPHAFFSVPIMREENDIQKHMRGWATPEEFAEYIRGFWSFVEVEVCGEGRRARALVHASTSPLPKPCLLTIGCSTLMDFWGVNYTLMSLYTQFQDLMDQGVIETVLVDNHPDPGEDPNDKEAIAIMERVAKDCAARYVQWCEKQGTYPGKNQLQVEARGKWVLTIDSHVFLSRGTLETILDLIQERPESNDLFHLPCLSKPGLMIDFRHLYAIYAGVDKAKKAGKSVYGYTGEMKKLGDPYPIAAQITSAYLVRRAAWFSGKGYDPILGMYGGWEGPLQVKWRLMGRDVLSIRHKKVKPIPVYHWHHFNTRVFKKAFKWAVDGMQSQGQKVVYHTGATKMRNYCASSAVTGGEAWVRRHCEIRGWNFTDPLVQEGMKAGLELRPWMIENLADPEWEDITKFFAWMKSERIPGHLDSW